MPAKYPSLEEFIRMTGQGGELGDNLYIWYNARGIFITWNDFPPPVMEKIYEILWDYRTKSQKRIEK